MPTAAVSAFGTTLSRGGNVIAELTNIGSPKMKMETIDVTTHQSADNYREFIGSLLDGGELNIDGNFIASDANGQLGLVADHSARTVQAFVITFPAATGAVFTFSGLVTAFEIDDAPLDGKFGFKATLKVSGKPVLTVATSAGLTTTFFAISQSAVIIPAPANATYLYAASVLTAVTGVVVTPVATAGVITVNGNVVATGQASSNIVLGAAGSVTTITIVVKETNKAAKTYIIYLARA